MRVLVLAAVVVALTAIEGGVSEAELSSLEVLQAAEWLRSELPGLGNAPVIKATHQVVAGMLYCLTFDLARGARDICVWHRPWIQIPYEIITQNLEDLRLADGN